MLLVSERLELLVHLAMEEEAVEHALDQLTLLPPETEGRPLSTCATAGRVPASGTEEVPVLPPELWLEIVHYFQRSDWPVAPVAVLVQ